MSETEKELEKFWGEKTKNKQRIDKILRLVFFWVKYDAISKYPRLMLEDACRKQRKQIYYLEKENEYLNKRVAELKKELREKVSKKINTTT